MPKNSFPDQITEKSREKNFFSTFPARPRIKLESVAIHLCFFWFESSPCASKLGLKREKDLFFSGQIISLPRGFSHQEQLPVPDLNLRVCRTLFILFLKESRLKMRLGTVELIKDSILENHPQKV